MKAIKIGDAVMWRGCFGEADPKIAVVKAIEKCPRKRMKEGTPVEAIQTSDKDFGVFTLDVGAPYNHWAYGSQIEPIPAP